MPTSFSHIGLCLFTFLLLLLQLLQNCYLYFCHCYHYYQATLLLNTLLQILSYPGVVELTTQLLILENTLWLPLCRINKFGSNTLPSKTVAIPILVGYQRATVFHKKTFPPDCWDPPATPSHARKCVRAKKRFAPWLLGPTSYIFAGKEVPPYYAQKNEYPLASWEPPYCWADLWAY